MSPQVSPTHASNPPVFQVLSLNLRHLAAGEVEDLLAQQLEDDHVVLTQALAGATGSHNVTDEGRPVLRPLLLQDLNNPGGYRLLPRNHFKTHAEIHPSA